MCTWTNWAESGLIGRGLDGPSDLPLCIFFPQEKRLSFIIVVFPILYNECLCSAKQCLYSFYMLKVLGLRDSL